MREIISRDEAELRGLRRYYTGKLCKRNHDAERYVINGCCVDCVTRRPPPGPNVARRNVRALPIAFYCEPMPTQAELIYLGNWLPRVATDEILRLRRDAAAAPSIPTQQGQPAADFDEAAFLAAMPDNLGELSPDQKEFARVENAWDEIEAAHGDTVADQFRPWLEKGWTVKQLYEAGHLPLIEPSGT